MKKRSEKYLIYESDEEMYYSHGFQWPVLVRKAEGAAGYTTKEEANEMINILLEKNDDLELEIVEKVEDEEVDTEIMLLNVWVKRSDKWKHLMSYCITDDKALHRKIAKSVVSQVNKKKGDELAVTEQIVTLDVPLPF